MTRRDGIEDASAGDGSLGRVASHDEPIAVCGRDRRFKAKLNESGRAGFDLVRFIQNSDTGQDLSSAYVNANALTRSDRTRGRGQDLELGVENLGDRQCSRRHKHHPAIYIGVLHACKIYRGPLPRMCS